MSESPSRAELVQRAREMVPVLAGRAEEAEKIRRIPDATIADMANAGFFRILQPKRWGGFEMDPQTFYDVQMTVAEGCMSTAWVLGVIAIHNWQLPLFDEQAQVDVWSEDNSTLISSSYAPVGKVERVDGGFNFSGRWSFSSGSEHCQWAFLGGIVPPEEGAPPGPPDIRTFLVPRSDYNIEDTWHVIGLKGTGSQDVVVDGCFVPEYRTHKAMDGFTCQNPGNATNPAPLYRVPFGQMFVRAVSSAAIGAAQGALDAYLDAAGTRVTSHGSKTAGDPSAQMNASRAADAIDEMKLVLFRNFDHIMECVNKGEEIPIEDRIRYRYQSAVVPDKCMQVVDALFTTMGGRGIFTNNPLQRFFLDIHAGRAHVANNPDQYGRNWGAVQLGLDNTDFFL